ncbi:PorP/SprF family type IX secretion system membrane protein [Maribacter dokdonensis]|uniref:PorP/SprF family type IX secretion system membrane protein n=1 Tax=Maribacter dokdonensis TaxID=320912 RepID=UPI002734D262|nr:type IX secretion system membrane protein PorP/SprF [Maribacter dokdonensis]MDP2527695.1 type IX secretion system membrane protein PorP/SprF [Maribacter dokdonensis]|tara:strand:+ start:1305 stop:2207 length:903 start_codon:yes stop_codon:yes gene_type:complete
MKKANLFLAILLFTGVFVNAQQLPQFTQYMYNTISVNPAYAGSRETLNATILHRNQWAGLEGNPRTSTLSVHSPLKNEKIGIGVSYINDRLGFESTNYFYGDFSYTVPVSQQVKMRFGLKGGFTSYNLENPDPNDQFFNANFNSINPNFGAGFYIGSNRWYAGISSPRILNTDLNEGEFEAIERNSYYAIGGLVFDLSETTIFKPTVITKFTNGAPATYDFTINFLFNEKFWVGTSYRVNDASNFGAMMDYQVSRDFRIGYAYDLPTSSVRPYTGGTHEIILIFELAKKVLGPVKSPRYF